MGGSRRRQLAIRQVSGAAVYLAGERLNMTDNPAVFETLDRSRRFTLRDPT